MQPIQPSNLNAVVQRFEAAARQSRYHAQTLIRIAADTVFHARGACMPKPAVLPGLRPSQGQAALPE